MHYFVSLRMLEYVGENTLKNQNLWKLRNSLVVELCSLFSVPYSLKSFDSWSDAINFYCKAIK